MKVIDIRMTHTMIDLYATNGNIPSEYGVISINISTIHFLVYIRYFLSFDPRRYLNGRQFRLTDAEKRTCTSSRHFDLIAIILLCRILARVNGGAAPLHQS